MELKQWWAGDPRERYWLELTDRDDLGVDLRAPETNESGEPDWHYLIAKLTQPGDVVFHYHKARDAIIAVSLVAGPWIAKSIIWGARGTFARAKGVKPYERPGFVVPLSQFTVLPESLTLDRLRALKPWLSELRTKLEAQYGKPTYLPFEVAERPVRMLQGYAFKLTQDFVLGVPELAPFADLALRQHFEAAVLPTSMPSNGQGFAGSVEVRQAVEGHAMCIAAEHFRVRGYAVDDVSRFMPFDLRVTNGIEELDVEVKGTTGTASQVFLTRNEVEHAKANHRRAVLFVVSRVLLTRRNGGIVATGGVPSVLHPWVIDESALEALQFRYTLPLGESWTEVAPGAAKRGSGSE